MNSHRLSKTKQTETREGSQYKSDMGYLPENDAAEIPPPPKPCESSTKQLHQQNLTNIVFDLETSSRGSIL